MDGDGSGDDGPSMQKVHEAGLRREKHQGRLCGLVIHRQGGAEPRGRVCTGWEARSGSEGQQHDRNAGGSSSILSSRFEACRCQ